MTREEIRVRRAEPPLTVVVHADSVEVESWDDARLDSAFRSLENQAAYALSQADLAVQDISDRDPATRRVGPGLAPAGRWRVMATLAAHPVRGRPLLVGARGPLIGTHPRSGRNRLPRGVSRRRPPRRRAAQMPERPGQPPGMCGTSCTAQN